MKLLFRYISIIAALLFVAYSCEVDYNGPMPNDMKVACLPYIDFDAAASDAYININSPGDYSFSGTIDVLFEDPFDKLTLVVVYNGAYDKQYVLKDNITEVPVSISVTSADIVAAVPELNSVADFKEGDEVHVFVVPTIGGKAYPPYQKLGNGSYNTVSTGVYTDLANIKGVTSADVVISVPCGFSVDDYLGVMYCKEDWGGGEVYEYTATVIEDPDYTGDGVGLVIAGLFDGADVSITKAVINLDDFGFTGPAQTLMPDVSVIGYPASYGALYFGKIAGVVNTCALEIKFTTSVSVDAGSFGPVTYTLQRLDYFNAKSSTVNLASSKPIKLL